MCQGLTHDLEKHILCGLLTLGSFKTLNGLAVFSLSGLQLALSSSEPARKPQYSTVPSLLSSCSSFITCSGFPPEGTSGTPELKPHSHETHLPTPCSLPPSGTIDCISQGP